MSRYELIYELWKREGYRAEQRERVHYFTDKRGNEKRGGAYPYWMVIDPDGNETSMSGTDSEESAWKAFRWHVYPFGISLLDVLKHFGFGGGNVVMESAGHDDQWFVYVTDEQYPSVRVFAEITTLGDLPETLLRARCAYLDHVAMLDGVDVAADAGTPLAFDEITEGTT